MSDLPERIWACRTEHNTLALTTPEFGAEYRRADLSAPAGYSREQLEAAILHYATSEDTADKTISYLTPDAKDPRVLVEALEWIANFAKGAEHPNTLTTGHALMMRGTAREALADWKGGRDE